MEKREVVVDGQRLAVFEAGEGEPCLLLHGYPQDHRCWRKVAPALSASHRVIAVDWFGWGESERSLEKAPRYEEDIERLGELLDVLGYERVNLFGHDYGGLVSHGFAARHPERVLRLALINARAHRTFTWFWHLFLSALVLSARTVGLRWLVFHGLPLFAMSQWVMRRFVANGSFSAAERDEYLTFLKRREGRRWFAHYYRHFSTAPRVELGPAAESLRMPTALIWGEKDPYFPVTTLEDLARRIPHAQVTRLPEADHYVVEERPEEVARALLELLEEPPGAPRDAQAASGAD